MDVDERNHSHPDLARFLDGERAEVWRATETGKLFHLPVGEADLHRPFTKEHLRCPRVAFLVSDRTQHPRRRTGLDLPRSARSRHCVLLPL